MRLLFNLLRFHARRIGAPCLFIIAGVAYTGGAQAPLLGTATMCVEDAPLQPGSAESPAGPTSMRIQRMRPTMIPAGSRPPPWLAAADPARGGGRPQASRRTRQTRPISNSPACKAGAEFKGVFHKFFGGRRFLHPTPWPTRNFDVVVIDMASEDSGDTDRDDTMHGADLFDVAHFSDRALCDERALSRPTSRLHGRRGSLTLPRGFTKDVGHWRSNSSRSAAGASLSRDRRQLKAPGFRAWGHGELEEAPTSVGRLRVKGGLLAEPQAPKSEAGGGWRLSAPASSRDFCTVPPAANSGLHPRHVAAAG